jgi:hypothetical protein
MSTLLRTVAQSRGDATFPAHLAPAGNATARIGYKAHRWHIEGRLEINWQKEGKDGKDPEREEAGWEGLRGGVVGRLLSARARALCETKMMRPSRTPWTNSPIRRRSFTNRSLSLSHRVRAYLRATNHLITVLWTGAAGTKQHPAGTSRPMAIRVLSCRLACSASHTNMLPLLVGLTLLYQILGSNDDCGQR